MSAFSACHRRVSGLAAFVPDDGHCALIVRVVNEVNALFVHILDGAADPDDTASYKNILGIRFLIRDSGIIRHNQNAALSDRA
jgi:hypothetical protein